MRNWVRSVMLGAILLGAGEAGAQAGLPLTNIAVDVLSDRGGVDLNPYFEHLVGALNRTWQPLVAKAESPLPSTPQATVIAVTILPDGKVRAMKLESSTQDEALNKVAWAAVAETKFEALPAARGGRPLKLRLHFTLN